MSDHKMDKNSEEIIIHVQSNRNKTEKEVVGLYKGIENNDVFRLIHFVKNGEPYSGIDIKKQIGWSTVTSAKREMEPAMWELYWLGKVARKELSIQESIMRIAVYVMDVFGSFEDILMSNKSPEIGAAIKKELSKA